MGVAGPGWAGGRREEIDGIEDDCIRASGENQQRALRLV